MSRITKKQRRVRRLMGLEQLEDRNLLATATWKVVAGWWDTSEITSSWRDDYIPQPGDNVFFNRDVMSTAILLDDITEDGPSGDHSIGTLRVQAGEDTAGTQATQWGLTIDLNRRFCFGDSTFSDNWAYWRRPTRRG